MHHATSVLALLLLASCTPTVDEHPAPNPLELCHEEQFSEALPPLFEFSELSMGRSWATENTTALGSTVFISTRSFGGRIGLLIREPFRPGDLPRAVTMPSGCVLHDSVTWHSDADGKSYPASVRVVGDVVPGAGGAVDLSLSNLNFERPDGGVEPLRDLHVQLPLE
jgi:hypothetical protein